MKKFVFDADVLISYTAVAKSELITRSMGKGHIIPNEVVEELRRQQFGDWADKHINCGDFLTEEVLITDPEYSEMIDIHDGKVTGRRTGWGETEGILLARRHGKVIASNNSKHISELCEIFGIIQIRTKDILYHCIDEQLFEYKDANAIWTEMKKYTALPDCPLIDLEIEVVKIGPLL